MILKSILPVRYWRIGCVQLTGWRIQAPNLPKSVIAVVPFGHKICWQLDRSIRATPVMGIVSKLTCQLHRKEGCTRFCLRVESSELAKQLLDELYPPVYQGMTSPIAYFPKQH